MKRTWWRCRTLDQPLTDEEGGDFETRFKETGRYEVADESKANLIGSQLWRTNYHAPVLDLDFPARLVPSTTEGHFHLYLDKPLDWRTYEKLLRALGDAGILEPGYVAASIRRKQTFVRKPGTIKGPDAPSSGRFGSA